MRDSYAPAAAETDAVGADRYRLFASASLGADIDLDETYRWGWDELFRIEDEMRRECGRIGQGDDDRADHRMARDPE